MDFVSERAEENKAFYKLRPADDKAEIKPEKSSLSASEEQEKSRGFRR